MNKDSLSFYLFAYWYDPRWKKFVGATVKIWDLATNLSKLGHDVVLFLPKYHFDIDGSLVKVVEIPFLNLPFLRSLSFNFFLTFFLMRFFFKTHPDIVYVRRMGSLIPGIYARLVKTVFFYEVNDDPYRRVYQEGSAVAFQIRKFVSEWQDKINLKLCQRVFVITKEISEKIQRLNPCLEVDKLIVMPSGANVDIFKPMSSQECRFRLNIDIEKKYVGFAGTFLNHQGVDVLIDAASLILRKEPLSLFAIIGEGPMKDVWIREVKRKGLFNSFLFPGQIDYEMMPIWIGAMDICVAPFLESSGLRSPVKIFDYMACGRAVVASRIDGTTDVFAGSEAIRLVPPGNVEILADAIGDLLSDKKMADKMGGKGRALVVEKYDRQRIAQRISEEAIACRS